MPLAPLFSFGAPTASVLPSPLSATESPSSVPPFPKWSPMCGFDALMYVVCRSCPCAWRPATTLRATADAMTRADNLPLINMPPNKIIQSVALPRRRRPRGWRLGRRGFGKFRRIDLRVHTDLAQLERIAAIEPRHRDLV